MWPEVIFAALVTIVEPKSLWNLGNGSLASKNFNFPISRLKLAKLVPRDSPLFADFKDTDLSIY
jgi:hypothetical protein